MKRGRSLKTWSISRIWSAVYRVESLDPDFQRKGLVLAVILAAMTLGTILLAGFNLAQGDQQYMPSNGLFLLFVVSLFVLNRKGYVFAAGMLTVVLLTLGAFAVLSEDSTLVTTYVVMCIPILLASFLLVAWSGIVIAALLIIGTIAYTGVAPADYPALLALSVVAFIAYAFSNSLNKAYSQTRHQALHDPLTGLPNRALFLDRLRQSVHLKSREPGLGAVLFMDLDGFKVVNDTLGHDLGDELLIQVAARLESSLRPRDTAARLGGDEFTVLLEGISGAGDAVNVAERVAEELSAPFDLRGNNVSVTTSIGIVLYSSPEVPPDVLLRDADVAMYEAKKAGKASYKVFNSGMYGKALGRLELERELKHAIEREELSLRYQPKVSTDSGEIVGMEALARWEHPQRGTIGPDEFIPLAEDSVLINALGRWVLENACRQARGWQERFPERAVELPVSVNLSMRQFRQPDLVGDLSRVLLETGLSPKCLQLEVTENVVMGDVEYAASILGRLDSLGVRLSIDDFGLGHSSLSFLKRFPLDELKIDRSFVAGMGKDTQDTAIVRLAIDVAHTFGLRAVGEGVETEEQLARLKDLGCDAVQGFYIWEPLTGEEVAEVLTKSLSPGQ